MYSPKRRRQPVSYKLEPFILTSDDTNSSEELSQEDITRCICESDEPNGTMIQCEECHVWQHCKCMNISTKKKMPRHYYCELCRPRHHPYFV